MKVRWTDEALRDLDEIVDYTLNNYPRVAPALDQRIRAVVSRIARWPNSAMRATNHPDIRVVPIGRYPFKVFYRVTTDAVEILHVHHSARRPWNAEPGEDT